MKNNIENPLLTGPKRQHYLPRFYLDGFARDGILAVYDRDSNEVRMQKPENTGVIGHFYTVEDELGRKRFEVEQILSEFESKAAPIIKKMATRENLSDDERSNMAIFVAMAMFRTPDMLDSIKAANAGMVKKMTKLTFGNLEMAKAAIRGSPTAPTSEEELDKEARGIVEFVQKDQYTIETNHRWALRMAIELFSSIAPILAGRDWLVVHRSNEKQSFVTTDSPLVLTTMEPRKNNFWGIGFANKDALVILPLTESCSLMIFGSDGDFNHKTVGAEQIRHFNLMVADRCQRFVIGRDKALVVSLAQRLGLNQKSWQSKIGVS
jgi:hypothetical protein